MSQHDAGPRPRQVTIGGWVVAVASLMLVVSVFDTMGNLQSVDTRDQLTKALTAGSAKNLGISVADALSFVRAALFVAGAAAAVTGILGIFVLQRHAAARIVLTIAAVPVVLTAPFAGGFLGLVVGASAAMLWTRPARDWFAGRPPAPATTAGPSYAPPARPGVSVPPAADGPVQPPPPTPAWGGPVSPPPPMAPPGHPSSAPPVSAYPPPQPPAWAPPGFGPLPQRPRVPAQVRAACVLTWMFAGLTAAGYLMLAAAVAVDRKEILDLLHDNPNVRDSSLSDDALVGLLVAVSIVFVLWCLASCVLAVFTWRRHTWAWIMLLVSVGVAALVSVLAFPFSLVHLAATATALGLLLSAPTRAWFRRPGGPGRPPGWSPPQQQPGPPQPDRQEGKPPVW